MNAAVSFGLTVGGALLAILGGALLFFNSAPDVPAGMVPRLPGDTAAQYFEDAARRSARRQRWSRVGFWVTVAGAVAGLIGLIGQWYEPTKG